MENTVLNNLNMMIDEIKLMYANGMYRDVRELLRAYEDYIRILTYRQFEDIFGDLDKHIFELNEIAYGIESESIPKALQSKNYRELSILIRIKEQIDDIVTEIYNRKSRNEVEETN